MLVNIKKRKIRFAERKVKGDITTAMFCRAMLRAPRTLQQNIGVAHEDLLHPY